MDTTTCITNTVWERYANKSLSAAQLLAMQQHVEGCELCADIKSGIDLMQNPATLTEQVAKINTAVDASLGAKTVKLNPWYMAVAATLLAVLAFALFYNRSVTNSPIAEVNKSTQFVSPIDSVLPEASTQTDTKKQLAVVVPKKAKASPNPAPSTKPSITPFELTATIMSDEHLKEEDNRSLVESTKIEKSLAETDEVNSKEAFTAAPTRNVQEVKSKAFTTKKPSSTYPAAYSNNNNTMNSQSNKFMDVSNDTNWIDLANKYYALNLADSCLMVIEPKLLNSNNAGYEQGLWLAAQCYIFKKDIPTAKLYLTRVVQLNGALKIKAQTLLNQLK